MDNDCGCGGRKPTPAGMPPMQRAGGLEGDPMLFVVQGGGARSSSDDPRAGGCQGMLADLARGATANRPVIEAMINVFQILSLLFPGYVAVVALLRGLLDDCNIDIPKAACDARNSLIVLAVAGGLVGVVVAVTGAGIPVAILLGALSATCGALAKVADDVCAGRPVDGRSIAAVVTAAGPMVGIPDSVVKQLGDGLAKILPADALAALRKTPSSRAPTKDAVAARQASKFATALRLAKAAPGATEDSIVGTLETLRVSAIPRTTGPALTFWQSTAPTLIRDVRKQYAIDRAKEKARGEATERKNAPASPGGFGLVDGALVVGGWLVGGPIGAVVGAGVAVARQKL